MNIKDLIMYTPFENVMSVISMHYGDKEEKQQRKLYYKLREMGDKPNTNGTTIFINAILCSEDEEKDDIVLLEFDEFNNELCFDVSAYENGSDIVYSIASAGYSELLGYYIDVETHKRFTNASILAHVLWEVTAYSYEDFE